jgi:hypothetical protein
MSSFTQITIKRLIEYHSKLHNKNYYNIFAPITIFTAFYSGKLIQKMVITNIFQIVEIQLTIFTQTFQSFVYGNKKEVLKRK